MSRDTITSIVIWALVIKIIFIGGDFSFIYWAQHGSKYTDWYSNRQTFSEYLKESK